MPMLRINSCTPNTPSYEESEEERLEREALREEKKLKMNGEHFALALLKLKSLMFLKKIR